MSNMMRAIRAFDRVISNSTEGWNEVEAADAHWDAGEWSGPAWARAWEAEVIRVTDMVADRFQICPDDLGSNWTRIQYHNLNQGHIAQMNDYLKVVLS